MDRAAQYMVRRCTSLAHLRPSPNVLPASSIRKLFIDYFCEGKNHMFIKSSPVFSLGDPTLAFVNAGMNQFKDVFLGDVEAPSPRVANFQKCIRILGKHDDLSLVGIDGRHHTFFEMLGNWSFNDYFKKDACKMAWEFLTQVCKLPSERLYVTYFGGDEVLGIPSDDEVKEIWREIGVKENHILSFGVKDNFWEAFSTGPCGPCTEIHYDNVPGRTNAASLVNTGNNEMTELWNLVFIQYNRISENELVKLKKHYVDTGMGFERLVAILQGKTSNYDTDLFYPLFDAIKKITRHSGYTGKYDGNPIDNTYRLLADHSRMISVGLADGMIPNHQYKIRKNLRSAFLRARNVFNIKGSHIFSELTKYVAETLSDAYPEIGNNLLKINSIIKKEEEIILSKSKEINNSWKIVTKNYPVLNSMDISEKFTMFYAFTYMNKNLVKARKKVVTSKDAWDLVSSFAVPVEEIQETAKYLKLAFNRQEFDEYAEHQKGKLKINSEKKAEKKDIDPKVINMLENKNLHPTVDYFKYDYRTDENGKYIFKEQPSTIVGIICNDKLVDEISSSDVQDSKKIGLVLDRTQFFSKDQYQESDSGRFVIEGKIHFKVDNVIKVKGLAVHFGKFTDFPSGENVSVNNIGVLHLDESKRLNIMRNHTALHILNAGVRKILPVCAEKRSVATSSGLKYVCMWYTKRLSFPDVVKVEKYVNDFIKHGVPVKTKRISLEDFYNEKDILFIPGEQPLTLEVPVVEINSALNVSKEYCRGTHVLNTSDLGKFVITKYIIGKFGASDIEAVTGEQAEKIIANDQKVEAKFSDFEIEISKNNLSEEAINSKIKDFKNDVLKDQNLSFICSVNINEKIQKIKYNLEKKKYEMLEKYRLRLVDEFSKSSKKHNNKFIVHYIDYPIPENIYKVWESLPVAHRRQPIFLFIRTGENVQAYSFVPKSHAEKGFSGEEWMTASLGTFGFCYTKSVRKQMPETFSTSEDKLTQEQLNKALDMAVFYAERHVSE